MDISRNKAEFGEDYDGVLREELRYMLKGLNSDSIAVELYRRIEQTLDDSSNFEVVSYNSGLINKLCRFVEVGENSQEIEIAPPSDAGLKFQTIS
jgi:hypothetical protein